MSEQQHNYWTYIMASVSRVIYVGVTNDLEGRVCQHKSKTIEGFTKKYNCTKLVWFEEFREIRDAIACEKRIKGLLRTKKIALIEEKNQYWKDLSDGWYQEVAMKNDRSVRDCHAERSEASQSLPVLPENDRDSSLRSE